MQQLKLYLILSSVPPVVVHTLIIDVLRLNVNRKFPSMINYIMVRKMKLSIGEKIKNLRENSNLTQASLGKALNMTQRKISYIEHDRYEPGIEDIKAICVFFEVSADYLLGITDYKK